MVNTSCSPKSKEERFRVDAHFSRAIGLHISHVDIRWGTKCDCDNAYAMPERLSQE